jgi:tellurite resistance protein TehA-like permease
MGYSKTINTIAASTFGVLMIHANSNTMRQWLWHDVFNNVGTYETGNVVVHAIVCVVAIYTICTVTDIVRIRFIEKPMLNKL